MVDALILGAIEIDCLEVRRVEVDAFVSFFDDKEHFGKILNCIRDDSIHNLVVTPNEPLFDCLVGRGARLSRQFSCVSRKFDQIRGDNLMQRFLFEFHLSEDHPVSLSFLDDLSLVSEKRGFGCDFF